MKRTRTSLCSYSENPTNVDIISIHYSDGTILKYKYKTSTSYDFTVTSSLSFIVPFFLVRFVVFYVLCFLFCLSSSCVLCAQGWLCSGLSILDCSFNLVCLKLTVLWIVHSWLSLRISLTFICQFLWIVHSWLLLRFSLTFICAYTVPISWCVICVWKNVRRLIFVWPC